MRKIVAIVSSPRKGGNSDTIVDAILDGTMGLTISEVNLHRLNNYQYAMDCQACMKCKEDGKCHVADSLNKTLEDIYYADSVIVSTPLYFSDYTGVLKCLIDRMFCFVDKDMNVTLPKGKKLVLVITCGSDIESSQMIAKILDNILVKNFGFENVGTIIASEKDMAENREKILAKAREIGKILVS